MSEDKKTEEKATKKVAKNAVVVEFITGQYKAYVVGDIAGFDKDTAEMLIKKKVAKKYKA